MSKVHICHACKQRNVEQVATHVMDTPKKGKWYLCTKHANAVNRTLYGSFNNLRPLTKEEYMSGNTPES